jgi:tetratricopeptide (TPR) repeat protein
MQIKLLFARGTKQEIVTAAFGVKSFWHVSPWLMRLVAIAIVTAGFARAEEKTWVKVTTEHFTILTPAGEPVARKWAIELEQFRRGLQAAVPVPVERLRPVTVVLFKENRAMEPFAPLENGHPVKIGGFFVRANDVNTIMLSVARNDAETRHVIFHEAVHWHLSAREGFMPLWLAEGLAEVYATFEAPNTRTYAFGAAFETHVARLREESLLPLPKLVGIGRDSLLYNEGTRTSIFYAQSWAFVHFLLFGEKSPGMAAVQRYLELLPVVRSPDEAFLTAFGSSYAALEQQLRRYIAGGRYHKHIYARSTDDIARRLKLSAAAPADIELAQGSLLLGARSPEDAEPYLGRAASLAPSDARAWELLGHIAVRRRDYSSALVFLTKAVAAGSTSYLVHHNLAVSRLPELIQPWMPNPSIDPQVLDAAAEDFRKAIQLSPSYIQSYEGLAGVARGMATFLPGDLELLARGLAQSPGNAMIEAGVAAAEVRAGRVADGRARLERLCARHPTATSAGMNFARRLLENEMLQAEMNEINRYSSLGQWEEVSAIVDRALARSLEPRPRQFMETMRDRATAYRKIQSAADCANHGDVTGATQMLEALLANDPEPVVAKEARRVLRELARVSDRGGPGRN